MRLFKVLAANGGGAWIELIYHKKERGVKGETAPEAVPRRPLARTGRMPLLRRPSQGEGIGGEDTLLAPQLHQAVAQAHGQQRAATGGGEGDRGDGGVEAPLLEAAGGARLPEREPVGAGYGQILRAGGQRHARIVGDGAGEDGTALVAAQGEECHLPAGLEGGRPGEIGRQRKREGEMLGGNARAPEAARLRAAQHRLVVQLPQAQVALGRLATPLACREREEE